MYKFHGSFCDCIRGLSQFIVGNFLIQAVFSWISFAYNLEIYFFLNFLCFFKNHLKFWMIFWEIFAKEIQLLGERKEVCNRSRTQAHTHAFLWGRAPYSDPQKNRIQIRQKNISGFDKNQDPDPTKKTDADTTNKPDPDPTKNMYN